MNTFERVIIEPFEQLFDKIVLFLPNFLAAILILVVGVIAAGIIKKIVEKILKALKIDVYGERIGLVETLGKGGIKEPASSLLARGIGWIIMFAFVITSLRSLDVPAVERLLEHFFLYLPHVFASLLILLAGYLLSNFFARAVLIAAVNAGMKVSGLIARFTKIMVILMAVTMALEQLGIGRETVIIAFAISFGGIVLALALAFGLGGRDLAQGYLEKKLKDEEAKDDLDHL